jgi:purine-binding chemotaxis protein CheW
MQTQTSTQPLNQYLSFFIAGDEYAISIVQIKEIIECEGATRVPGTPSWIRGVINLRGSVVPVIDLAVKFGLPQTELTRRSCVIIVEWRAEEGTAVIGVMADAVHQVFDLGPSEIQAPPLFGPKVRVDCILGMGASDGKFVVLLDIDRILSSSELLAAEQAADAQKRDDASVSPNTITLTTEGAPAA